MSTPWRLWYDLLCERLPPGALANPDETPGFPAKKGDEMSGFGAGKGDEPSGFAARTPDEMTGKPLTVCHPISKRDNKDFKR